MELYNQIKQIKEYLLAVKLLLHCQDEEIRELLVKELNEMQVRTVFWRRAIEERFLARVLKIQFIGKQLREK